MGRDDARREELQRDRARRDALRRERIVNLKAMGLTLAIVTAPFIGLLYGLNVALAVLAAALAFTTWLTWHTVGVVNRGYAARLRVAAILNGVLTVATLVILALRLTS